MLRLASCVAVLVALIGSQVALAAQKNLVEAKDGSGIVGYKDTPVQPWSGYHVHDPDRPAPPRVEPGQPDTEDKPGTAPSDAVVLFDGKDIEKWKPADEWKIEQGLLIAGKGLLTTKKPFGDCQLHLEWQAPNPPVGEAFNRGNNGVFMMGLFEIQIFDSFSVKLYPDGQAASIYAQTPPLVNAIRKPGEWQSYDIIMTAPVYQDGKMVQPARVTMLHNGVLVHLNQEVYGSTPHRGLAKYPAQPITQGPLSLMGHSNPVKFRNIWIRKLETGKK